ncbi:unnamed protein product [Soboliphyme baturini]|uniref:AA_kinase domain-containing protein n=1 Tax=Soboliphyme baturini TaxID=241478 RepID=A0A183ICA8_9BILA|nr:unnamed protein product [Soboliphyme baturini]
MVNDSKATRIVVTAGGATRNRSRSTLDIVNARFGQNWVASHLLEALATRLITITTGVQFRPPSSTNLVLTKVVTNTVNSPLSSLIDLRIITINQLCHCGAHGSLVDETVSDGRPVGRQNTVIT